MSSQQAVRTLLGKEQHMCLWETREGPEPSDGQVGRGGSLKEACAGGGVGAKT